MKAIGLFSIILFTGSYLFSQTEDVFTKVEGQYNTMASEFGELPKGEKEYFINAISSHYVYKEESFLIDENSRFESYLNKVFKTIAPNLNHYPKCRLYKSAYPNAFTEFLGEMNFHWGILAELESEASLAFLMGHEYGHYRESHLYKSYSQRDINEDSDREAVIKHYHDEQSQEFESDSIGFLLGQKAGYDWEQGLVDFYEFVSMDTLFSLMESKANIYEADGKISTSTDEDNDDSLFISHPPTLSRIKKWKNWGSKVQQYNVKYIVSKKDFLELQNYSKLRTLNHFLKCQDYKMGLIKAFKYFALSPDNPDFQYYLYEFIRRKLLQNKGLADKKFMSDIFVSGNKIGIFKNLKWVFNQADQVSFVKNNLIPALGGENISYDGIKKYLEKIESKNTIPEYYLSKALFNFKDRDIKNSLLDKYLSFDNIKYREYAESFKKDELSFAIRTQPNDIAIFDDIKIVYRDKNGITTKPKESKVLYHESAQKVSDFIHSKDKSEDFIFTHWNAKSNSLNKEEFYNSVKSYINLKEYYEQSDITVGGASFSSWSAHIASPEIWTFMYRNKIRTIELYQLYDFNDMTVSLIEQIKNGINGLATIGHDISYSNIKLGDFKWNYFLRKSTLDGASLDVSFVYTSSRQKLTMNRILTEIYLLK